MSAQAEKDPVVETEWVSLVLKDLTVADTGVKICQAHIFTTCHFLGCISLV